MIGSLYDWSYDEPLFSILNFSGDFFHIKTPEKMNILPAPASRIYLFPSVDNPHTKGLHLHQ